MKKLIGIALGGALVLALWPTQAPTTELVPAQAAKVWRKLQQLPAQLKARNEAERIEILSLEDAEEELAALDNSELNAESLAKLNGTQMSESEREAMKPLFERHNLLWAKVRKGQLAQIEEALKKVDETHANNVIEIGDAVTEEE